MHKLYSFMFIIVTRLVEGIKHMKKTAYHILNEKSEE